MAADSSGIQRVVAAYTDDRGEWRSLDFTQKPSGEFVGILPAHANRFVQVVDNGGNVAGGRDKQCKRALPLSARHP